MAAIVGFAHLITGFDNKTITGLMSSLLDQPYSTKRATYDPRRLCRKDLIEQRPHSNRYLLTDRGRRVAVLFTKLRQSAWARAGRPRPRAARRPGQTKPTRHRLACHNRELDHHIDRGLAAA